MLGSVDNCREYGQLTVQPDEINMRGTQTPPSRRRRCRRCLCVAKANGATVILMSQMRITTAAPLTAGTLEPPLEHRQL